MKRLYACMFVLTLFIAGCSEQGSLPSAQPPSVNAKVEVTIESKQSTFKVGEDATIMIRIKNLTDKELDAPATYWSIRIIVDGKEYKRPDESVGPWSGPGVIIPDGELYMGLTLSSFISTGDVLTVGKHTVSVKIGDAVSNTLTIIIEEDR